MKGFAEWVSGRAYRAGLAAAALALVPPLAFASSAVLVATSLRRGVAPAALGAAIATGVLAAVGVIGQASPFAAALAALLFWLPALLLTEALRRSGSLDVAGQAAAAGALVLAGVATMAGGGGAWLGKLGAEMQAFLEQAGNGQVQGELFVAILPGALAASLLMASLLGLLLGMWWHAALVRPGAFGETFRRFRLGRLAATVTAALLAGLLLSGNMALANLLLAVVLAFMLQGLAVIHGLAAILAWPTAGLVVVYVLLVFGMSVMVPLLATFGLVDNWLDFRRRAARAAGKS